MPVLEVWEGFILLRDHNVWELWKYTCFKVYLIVQGLLFKEAFSSHQNSFATEGPSQHYEALHVA